MYVGNVVDSVLHIYVCQVELNFDLSCHEHRHLTNDSLPPAT